MARFSSTTPISFSDTVVVLTFNRTTQAEHTLNLAGANEIVIHGTHRTSRPNQKRLVFVQRVPGDAARAEEQPDRRAREAERLAHLCLEELAVVGREELGVVTCGLGSGLGLGSGFGREELGVVTRVYAKAAQPSASWFSGGCFQRQITLKAAQSSG